MARRWRSGAVGAGLALIAAGCADDSPRSGLVAAQAAAGQPTAVTLVGRDIMFDITEMTAAVGETLTIKFVHDDPGIAHNLVVEGTAAGKAETGIVLGPATQVLEVTFDQPGEYEYLCAVHPREMRGTITVTA